AAMLTCAAAATRNDDGSCGSSPVSVTAPSAAGSPPAEFQTSERISRGLCIRVTLASLSEHDLRANARRCREGKPLHTFPDHALLPVIGQHLVAGFRESRAVLLQAGEHDLVAVIHMRAAKARDVARAGVVSLLRGGGRGQQG